MEPYNLDMLYKSFTKYSKEVVLYLPRNSDLNQIARYVPEGQKLEVAHYAIMAASKVRIHNAVGVGFTNISRRYARTLGTLTSTFRRRRKSSMSSELNNRMLCVELLYDDTPQISVHYA